MHKLYKLGLFLDNEAIVSRETACCFVCVALWTAVSKSAVWDWCLCLVSEYIDAEDIQAVSWSWSEALGCCQ